MAVADDEKPPTVATIAALPAAAPAALSDSVATGYLERIAVEMRGQVRVVPVATIEYIAATKEWADKAGKGDAWKDWWFGDAAKDVTGQIFAVRMNEIFLMSQSRPLRSIHRAEGWTPQTLAEHGIPALKSSFYKLDRSADIFNWDAI